MNAPEVIRQATMSGADFLAMHGGDKPNGAASVFNLTSLCLSPAEWLALNIPSEDLLLGPFSTTTRVELSADTGLGKTMLGLALSHAKAIGADFLHWKATRPARVLYVDGEMPRELIKARLKIAQSWFGIDEPLGRDQFCLLARADFEDIPPLDTADGARWLFGLIEQLGRFDHVTLDNRASLTAGDLSGDDASTQAVKSLQREITKQSIGQLWLHHTGLEASRGYGRKSREWELDSVAIGERLDDRPGADVAMRISFTKARRRTPDNRADYEPVNVELRNGQWFWTPGDIENATPVTKLGRNQRIVYDAAIKLLAGSDAKAPPGHPAGHATVITVDSLKEEVRKLLSCEARYFASRFGEAVNGISNSRKLNHYDGFIWAPR